MRGQGPGTGIDLQVGAETFETSAEERLVNDTSKRRGQMAATGVDHRATACLELLR